MIQFPVTDADAPYAVVEESSPERMRVLSKHWTHDLAEVEFDRLAPEATNETGEPYLILVDACGAQVGDIIVF